MVSLKAKFEEHLSCAICLEQFHDPKVLPCLHSYCHECIMKLEKTGNDITCPECRMTVEVGDPTDISFLPSNFFAKNLLATLSLASDSDLGDITCENCDSGDCAEARCEQCNRYLCQYCIGAHKRSRDTKHHRLRSLNELKESGTPIIAETIRCSKHKDEIIKLYCTTCESTICRDCTIIDHREHDFSFVGDVAQEKRDQLQKLLGEVKERKVEVSAGVENVIKTEESLNARTESTIAKINLYFENIGKVLGIRKNQLIEEANVLKDSKLKQLHAQREQLEVTLASCESNIEFTEQAFKNGDDVQILNMKKYITQSLESLKNRNTETQPCVDDQIEFITGLTESEAVDKTVMLCSVVDETKSHDRYKCSFKKPQKTLTVGIKCEIAISGQPKNGNVNIKPIFTGVEVKDVAVFKNEDCTHTVSFVPLEVGVLKFDGYINGRSTSKSTLSKSVMWDWVLKDTPARKTSSIGDCILETGIHTWKIELDHKSCLVRSRADFTIGVISRDSDDIINGYQGFVQSECSISVELDMSKKKLTITGSWGRKVSSVYDVTSSEVSPFFKIDCEQCNPLLTEMGPFFR